MINRHEKLSLVKPCQILNIARSRLYYKPRPVSEFVYLTVIMDWYSRKILSWRLSNSLDVSFCVDALEEALYHYGIPEIFNTDQGSQYTSEAFTGVLKARGIGISMNGKGAWRDNVFVERLWRSVKYEEVCFNAYESMHDARQRPGRWVDFYNRERKHQTLKATPDQKSGMINQIERLKSNENNS